MENQWTFDDISDDNFVIDMEQEGGNNKEDHNGNDNYNTGGTYSLSDNSNQSDQQWLKQLRQAPSQQQQAAQEAAAAVAEALKIRKSKPNKTQSKPCIVLDSDESPKVNNNNKQKNGKPNNNNTVSSVSVQELQQQLNKLQSQLKPKQQQQQSQTLQGPMPFNIMPLNKQQDPQQVQQFKEKLFSQKPPPPPTPIKTFPKLTEKNFQKIMKTAMKLKTKVERYMAGH